MPVSSTATFAQLVRSFQARRRVDVVVGAVGQRVLLHEAGVVGVLGHRHRHVVLDAQHARRRPQALSQRLQRVPVADVDRSASHQTQPQAEATAGVADRAPPVGVAARRGGTATSRPAAGRASPRGRESPSAPKRICAAAGAAATAKKTTAATTV